MARACTVCTHPLRGDIDAAIVRGEPNRRVAAHHGIAETSIRRHKVHVSRDLQSAKAAQPAQPAQVVERVRTLAGQLDAAHRTLDSAQTLGAKSPDALVKVVGVRVKLLALEFGTKRTTTVVDARQEWEALSLAERRERLVEMKHRVLELEAEMTGGEH